MKGKSDDGDARWYLGTGKGEGERESRVLATDEEESLLIDDLRLFSLVSSIPLCVLQRLPGG